MNQEQFISHHQPQWQALERWLDVHTQPRKKQSVDVEAAEGEIDFPALYRQTCHHLALARSRLYSQQVISRLDRLVFQAHQHFYQPRPVWKDRIFSFVLAGFPAIVRREWRLIGLSTFLFFGPMIGMIIVQQSHPEMIYTLMNPAQVHSFETMYAPEHSSRIGRERQSQSDFLMFGYYIRNNTSIGFQTFAGGLLFGLGTLFFLLFNGLYIGAAAGHLTYVGYNTTFWSFVVGHSSLELMAIAISGAAGLKLGNALLNPGRLSRIHSLRKAGRNALKLIYGAALMFFLAAFIEAFWSSIAWVAPAIKYVVGISLWILLILYFQFAGRHAT